MGFNIRMMRKYLDAQLFKPRPVMESLDLAMEVLLPFTEFHKISFELFLKFTVREPKKQAEGYKKYFD
jgi:hypothetical protein